MHPFVSIGNKLLYHLATGAQIKGCGGVTPPNIFSVGPKGLSYFQR